MSPGIYIVNADRLDSVTFVDDDETLNVALQRAYESHVLAGRDTSCLGYGPRVLGRFERDYAEEFSTADRFGMEPVALTMGHAESRQFEAGRDWSAELRLHSPKVYRAVLRRKLSFAAMLEHSKRWHEDLARKAARLRDRAIERDDEGAPTVLEIDGDLQGWRWVWLKSASARAAEGDAMGHCVGGGAYDDLGPNGATFSLRDPAGRPHVTVEMEGLDVEQSRGRGNGDVAARYRSACDRLQRLVGPRLLIAGDPTVELADGYHMHEPGSRFQIEAWTVGGVLHRIGGPAVLSPTLVRYFDRGLEGRRFSIFSESYTTLWEFYRGGQLHREDGPARYSEVTGGQFPRGPFDVQFWRDGQRVNEDGTRWIGGTPHRFYRIRTNAENALLSLQLDLAFGSMHAAGGYFDADQRRHPDVDRAS